jgi:hypothetical protein
MIIPPVIARSRTKNLREKYDFTENYKLIEEESPGGMGFRKESLANGR